MAANVVIKVKQLGLAAFIRMNGAELVKVEDKHFHLQTDKTLDEWRIDYSNSCCMKHDALVCEMRYFLK